MSSSSSEPAQDVVEGSTDISVPVNRPPVAHLALEEIDSEADRSCDLSPRDLKTDVGAVVLVEDEDNDKDKDNDNDKNEDEDEDGLQASFGEFLPATSNSSSNGGSKVKVKLSSEAVLDLLKVLTRNSPHIPESIIDLLEDQLGYKPFNVRDIGYYEGMDAIGNVNLSPLASSNNSDSKSNSKSNSNSSSVSVSDSNSSISNSISNSSSNSTSCRQPAVAVLYPLNFNLRDRGRYTIEEGLRPFPTTFWMTSPLLRAKISVLEHAGWISRIDKTLKSRVKYVEQMIHAHRLYADERWGMLTSDDMDLVRAKDWEFALKTVGIAGIREPSTVKCLHCHYSHHLARPHHNNLIGMWVQEIIDTGSFNAEKTEAAN